MPIDFINGTMREIGSHEPQNEKVIGENEKPLVSPPHKP